MKEYLIKQGEHYSNHSTKLYFGKKKFELTVEFTDSCRYNLQDLDQLDINKLCGVSFGSHEKNSIRIGWNYNLETDKIDLFYYTYQNYVRNYGFLRSVSIGSTYKFTLELLNYGFTFDDNVMSGQFIEYYYPFLKVGYYLYPYFGGNKAAPHDIFINMDFK